MAEEAFDFTLLDTEPVIDTPVSTATDTPVIDTPIVSEPNIAPESSTTDTFDYSAPLTPREKFLMERIERVTGDQLDAATTQRPAEIAAPIPSERNFLEGINDLDEVFSSTENFNKLLLAVHNNALEEASKLTAERILSNLPQIMSKYVTQHISMNRLVDEFYTANADLVPVKRTVTAVANEIATEHPEYTTQQVFDATASKTREILKLQQAPPRTTTRPALIPPKGSRIRMSAPVLSDIEKGVMDLIT